MVDGKIYNKYIDHLTYQPRFDEHRNYYNKDGEPCTPPADSHPDKLKDFGIMN